MLHEVWIEPNGCTACLHGGKLGDQARSLLDQGAELIWTFEADSHFEAMVKYYKFMDWSEYTSSFPEHDKKSYSELGFE
jgi:hypothetical protein